MIKIYDKEIYATNYGHIYIAQCLVGGKVYVGQTKQEVKNRWQNHLNNVLRYKNPFQNALRKHGKDKFIVHVVPVRIMNADELNLEEIRIIELLHSTNRKFGYNIHHGGGASGVVGKETRRKLSHNNGMKTSSTREKQKTSQHSISLAYIDSDGNEMVFESKGDIMRYLKVRREKIDRMIKSGEILSTKKKANFCMMTEKYWGVQCLNDKKIYSSVREVAKKYNVGRTNLRLVLDGIIDSVKGFRFRYVYR